jgi:hypothetical protein
LSGTFKRWAAAAAMALGGDHALLSIGTIGIARIDDHRREVPDLTRSRSSFTGAAWTRFLREYGRHPRRPVGHQQSQIQISVLLDARGHTAAVNPLQVNGKSISIPFSKRLPLYTL